MENYGTNAEHCYDYFLHKLEKITTPAGAKKLYLAMIRLARLM